MSFITSQEWEKKKDKFNYVYARGFSIEEWETLFGEVPVDTNSLPENYHTTAALWRSNRGFQRCIGSRLYGFNFNYEVGLAHEWAVNPEIDFDEFIKTASSVIFLRDGIPIGYTCNVDNVNGLAIYWNDADDELSSLYEKSALPKLRQPRDGKTVLEVAGW